MTQKKQNYYRYYFILKIKRGLQHSMADALNLKLFNHKKGFITQFLKEEARYFDPLRVFDKHKILMTVLNEEFSVQNFTNKGAIEAHFPLHQFHLIKNIRVEWKKERAMVLFDNLKSKVTSKDLRPYNSIAFYYGCDLAYYLNFNAVYTSYLMILSFIGVILYALMFLLKYFFNKRKDAESTSTPLWMRAPFDRLNNFLVPFYVLFISIWVTVAFEKWKQREKEFAFIWNTLNFEEKRVPRPTYKGMYVIDDVTKEVRLQDPFPTRYRRWFTNIPLLILAIGLIAANFTFFTYFTEWLSSDNRGFTDFKKQLYLILCNVLNGVIIFVFGLIYNFVSVKAVRWENHRFENTKENSLIIKTFAFDFTLAYINLFYYSIIKRNFNLLANAFISIVITKNLLFNFKTNIIPWFRSYVQKKFMLQKWRKARVEIKRDFLEKEGLGHLIVEGEVFDEDTELTMEDNFNSLSEQKKQALIKFEKKLVLQEQIERTMTMSQISNLRLVWTNYAIQFGYISFFSLAFPMAPLIGLLLNLFDLQFSYFALTDHIRRKLAVERGSIGIWNHIFTLMSFCSLFVNLAILILDNDGIKSLISIFTPDVEHAEKYDIAIYVAFAEHLIFLLKFMLALSIQDVPKWVRDHLEDREHKENIEIEKLKKKYFEYKNRDKLRNNVNIQNNKELLKDNLIGILGPNTAPNINRNFEEDGDQAIKKPANSNPFANLLGKKFGA